MASGENGNEESKIDITNIKKGGVKRATEHIDSDVRKISLFIPTSSLHGTKTVTFGQFGDRCLRCSLAWRFPFFWILQFIEFILADWPLPLLKPMILQPFW